MEQKRELRAIMFTDMKSFSRMMGQDENRTIRLVKEHRDLFRNLLPKYRGVEQSTSGDSFFVIFNSALEAVNCAIEIQQTLETRNNNLDAAEQIWIRIGIHLGDVFYDDGDKDVFGEAINIAARTEPLARTGGICITGPVYGQVKSKLTHGCQYGGKLKMKNIADVPDVYHVLLTEQAEVPVNRKLNLLLVAAVVTIALLAGVWFQLKKVVPPVADPSVSETAADTEIPVSVAQREAIPVETVEVKPDPVESGTTSASLQPGDLILSSRLLTSAELTSVKTAEQAENLMTGIWARKGMTFDDPDTRAYYEKMTWYKATITEDSDVELTPLEEENRVALEMRIRDITREEMIAHPELSGFPGERIVLFADRRWPGVTLSADVMKDLNEFTIQLTTWLEDHLLTEKSIYTLQTPQFPTPEFVKEQKATMILALRIGGLRGNHFQLSHAPDPDSKKLAEILQQILIKKLAGRLEPLPLIELAGKVQFSVPSVLLVAGPDEDMAIYELYESGEFDEVMISALREGVLMYLQGK